jgi:predicted amidohydrolase
MSRARLGTLVLGLSVFALLGACAENENKVSGQQAAVLGVVKVAAAQTRPILFDNAANLADILAKIDTAAAAGAKLVVFPELALNGYKFKSIQEARPFAEPVPGPAVAAVAERARAGNLYVAFGMLEVDGVEIYNSSVLVAPEGYIGKYRKAHGGYRSESKLFSRGDTGFPVFETAIGRIGLGICYDANFPEAARVAALQGAHILVQPQNDGSFFWPELVLARSTENRLFAVVANRIGTERFNTFGGNSLVAGPNWTTLVRANDTADTIVYADVDLSLVDPSWQAAFRPKLYKPIAEPLPPQLMSIEMNPESQVFGTPETIVARVVTASVREQRRWAAELVSSSGAAVITEEGRTGDQGITVDMPLPADLPLGTYSFRVTVGHDSGLSIEAPFVVQDLPRPRAVGTRPTDLPATPSGTIHVGLDRDIAPATGVQVVLTGGATPLTFTGSVNTTIVDNRFAANYSGLAAGTTYTATIAAGELVSVASGAGNEPLAFQFTTLPAVPFQA